MGQMSGTHKVSKAESRHCTGWAGRALVLCLMLGLPIATWSQTTSTSDAPSTPSGGSGGVVIASICVDCDPPPDPTPTTPALDAVVVGQTVPAAMTTGQSYPVTVQMQNVGTQTWTAATNIKLGSQNPIDNSTWGLSRVLLTGSIGAGQTATFSFNVTAPVTAGTYNFQWSMVQDGAAIPRFGASTSNVAVTVSAASGNTPPTVSLTAPANGASAVAPASILLTASASDPGGSISSVAFWSNGTLLGPADTSAPYTWSLSGLAAGTYLLKAVATDNGGAATMSSQVTYTVTAAATTVSMTRSYVYDENQRLCKIINPESGATVVAYDLAGNIDWTAEGTTFTSLACDRASIPDAQRTTRTYDKRNRLLQVSTPLGTADLVTTYEPDGLVKTLTAANPGGNNVLTTYTYNKRRMLTGESSSNGTTLFSLGYGYNSNGHLSAITYPDLQTVAYAPDALGRATQVAVTGGATYASAIKYFPNGAISGFTYGNGAVHTLTQNKRGFPANSLDKKGTVKILDDSYVYDANGNVDYITDARPAGATNRTRDLGYDQLDRMIVADAPNQWVTGTYKYDALDNLRVADLSVTSSGARVYRYNYDASTGRLATITDAGGTPKITLGYDASGNTTSKAVQGGSTQQLVFDSANRLSQVTGSQTYRYDGQGRRVETKDADGKTTFWIYSQSGQVLYTSEARRSQNLSYIYLGNTQVATRAFAWGSGTITVSYQHTDALGSPVAESNSAGTVTKRNSYAPYGEAWNSTIDGTGYTGHVMDQATGLTYMQQRYYDPQIGRFLSSDPVSTNANTGASFNRYSYANNSPYKFTDPDGRQSVGEMIDDSAMAAAGRGDGAATYGWAFAATAWKFFGAEGVSQLADKGSSATTGDKVSAGLETLAAVPLVKILGEVATVGKELAGAEKAVTQGPRYATGKLREQVMAKGRQADGTVTCVYCGKPTATASDHIVPHSKGGPTAIENLDPACIPCNSSKGVKELHTEWVPPKDRNP